MIDARLVGAFLVIFTLLLLPLLKWLGGLAVASAFEKITGLDAKLTTVAAQFTQTTGRLDDHGRKIAIAQSTADQGYRKAEHLEPRVSELEIQTGRIEGRVDRNEKDIDKLEDQLREHELAAKAG